METPELEIVDLGELPPELVAKRHRIIQSLWWGEAWPGNLKTPEKIHKDAVVRIWPYFSSNRETTHENRKDDADLA